MSIELDKISKMDREEFFRSFIDTLLWTEKDEASDESDRSLSENYGIEDIAPQVIEGLKEQCNRFIDENSETLLRVGQGGYDFSQAGHDFCLSRNGHGAGFFDRGLEDDGDALQKAAESARPADAYTGDDGIIYVGGLELYGQQSKSPKLG